MFPRGRGSQKLCFEGGALIREIRAEKKGHFVPTGDKFLRGTINPCHKRERKGKVYKKNSRKREILREIPSKGHYPDNCRFSTAACGKETNPVPKSVG